MNLRVIIIDDEYLAIRLLEEYCSRFPFINVLQSFKDPVPALRFLEENPVDLVFLDIQMPRITGMELASRLSPDGAGKRPRFIFTTARHDFAVKAFELDALDYLVKPVSFERFEMAIRKVEENILDFLLLKNGHRTIRLAYEEIIFIEGLNEYVKVHTPEKKIVTLAALKDLEARLPRNQFVRIHKSYIVSLAFVRSWTASEVEMAEGQRLPLGRVYKDNFLGLL
ncbi:MAG: response regulator transcription factor [Bacteroidetes bacterium]|nr:response regulator transcription factor [Bacteroidota bacterium]